MPQARSVDVHGVLDLAKVVKEAVEKHHMLGWQYNTIGVSKPDVLHQSLSRAC